jgi:predicted extracellular nuclease
MKKNVLVLVFAFMCFKISNAQFGVPCTDLFISEYLSPGAGHAGDKSVEIYNPSSVAISLAGYKLAQYSNGTCNPTSTFSFPNKVLAPGDVYVINNGATGVDASVVLARDTTWGV